MSRFRTDRLRTHVRATGLLCFLWSAVAGPVDMWRYLTRPHDTHPF